MEAHAEVAPRPRGCPIMYQRWEGLAFLHWSFAPAVIRPLLPPALELDLFDGRAWVGVTPFRVRGMRAPFTPRVPGLSDSYEINVRTYVRWPGDIPAVWFFSLDATNALAVWGARLAFRLPYFQAAMAVETEGSRTTFRSRRTHRGAPSAELDAQWHVGEALPEAQPGTLEFFLTERYALFAARGAGITRGRIQHRPWRLRAAHVLRADCTLLVPPGLGVPTDPPHVLAQADTFPVGVWRPRSFDPNAPLPGDRR